MNLSMDSGSQCQKHVFLESLVTVTVFCFLIKWKRYPTCKVKLINECVVGTQWGGAVGAAGTGEGQRRRAGHTCMKPLTRPQASPRHSNWEGGPGLLLAQAGMGVTVLQVGTQVA